MNGRIACLALTAAVAGVLLSGCQLPPLSEETRFASAKRVTVTGSRIPRPAGALSSSRVITIESNGDGRSIDQLMALPFVYPGGPRR